VKREFAKLLQSLLRGLLSQAKKRNRSGLLLIVVLTIAVFAVGWWLEEPNAPIPERGADLSCRISEVYDGDTVAASCDNGKLKVRLFGIDAPEMKQKPWGDKARAQLRYMVPHTKLRLLVMDMDRYGRVVARLYDGDRDLGLQLVRQGWAVVYAQYNSLKAYRVAQAEAKQEKLGVWSQPGSQQEPWEWRKLNPR
jgi:micrococcal nuclease